jgi:hypothetical protein
VTTKTTETSAAVRGARETLAHTSTATANVSEMSRVELCSLIGRLQGSLLALVQYVHFTQQIARHEQSARETQARIDARTMHTGDLDHALADVFHTHRADSVRFTFDPDLDAARRYGADAWAGPDHFFAMGATPSEALATAMCMRMSAAGRTR